MVKKLTITITPDQDSGYIGKVQELQGCITQGDTISELLDNVKEAIELTRGNQ